MVTQINIQKVPLLYYIEQSQKIQSSTVHPIVQHNRSVMYSGVQQNVVNCHRDLCDIDKRTIQQNIECYRRAMHIIARYIKVQYSNVQDSLELCSKLHSATAQCIAEQHSIVHHSTEMLCFVILQCDTVQQNVSQHSTPLCNISKQRMVYLITVQHGRRGCLRGTKSTSRSCNIQQNTFQ